MESIYNNNKNILYILLIYLNIINNTNNYIYKYIIINWVLNFIYFTLNYKINFNYTKNLLIFTNYKLLKLKSINTDITKKSSELDIKKQILEIKTVSHTSPKGRINLFKVTLIIGIKGAWLGIGNGKDYYLLEAIDKAYYNAFKHIYYINNSNININNLKLKYKASICLLNSIYGFSNKLYKVPYWLEPVFDLLNLNFMSCKLLKSKNKLNNIKAILNYFTTKWN